MTDHGAKRQGPVGIVGAGLMGGGIAALICGAGLSVKVFDENAEQLSSLEDRVKTIVDELEKYGLAEPGTTHKIKNRLEILHDYSGLVGSVAVIEAVFEDPAVKSAVYSQIEKYIDTHTILATNTSNIVPSDLIEGMQHPERFLVIHFWNPPHAIPLVEIVPHSQTSSKIIDKAVELVKIIGNEPVVLSKEVAGFIGNRLQYALLREALWIVQNGIADFEEVDRAMTLSLGRRYATTGPFATADLGGLDTFLTISQQLMPQLASDISPIKVMEQIVSKGDKGTKTGCGFLSWPEKRSQMVINSRNDDLLRRRKEERDNSNEDI